jgi:aspartate racemase
MNLIALEIEMKTIGMIGGMSWESSIEYYRIINETVRTELDGLHSAKSLMVSVEFAEIEALQHQGRWDEAAEILIDAARSLESGGADFAIICTNTMHKLYDKIQQSVRIPLLHIADATANAIKAEGIQKTALWGTRFTMEENFYKGWLITNYGLDVIIPAAEDMEIVHRIIYDELCAGIIQQDSKRKYKDIITQHSKVPAFHYSRQTNRLSSRCLERPGTQFVQGAGRTFGFAGRTRLPAEKNQLKTEIIPFPLGNNFHQIELDFHRIFVFGQSQPP